MERGTMISSIYTIQDWQANGEKRVPFIKCSKCNKIPYIRNIDSFRVGIYCNKCESIEIKKISEIISKNSPFYSTQVANCSNPEHADTKSIKFCTECSKYLCSICLKDHHIYNSSHIIMNPYLAVSSKCKKHNNYLSYYCEDTEEEICTDCLLEHQKKHNHIKLSSIVNEEIEKNIIKNLDDAKELINVKYPLLKGIVINEIHNDIFDTIREHTFKLKKVKDKYDEIVKNLNVEYQKSVKELVNNSNDRIKQLKDYIVKIKEAFSSNQGNNNNLIKYIELLMANFKILQGKYNYSVMNNLACNSKFEIKEYKLQLKNYEKVIEYFKGNLILKEAEILKSHCPRCKGKGVVNECKIN